MDNYSFLLYSQLLKTFWRIFLIILGIAFIIVLFPYTKYILIMVIISGLLAMLLSPLVDFFESRGLGRGLSILIVMVLIVALLALSIRLIMPRIIRAVETLSIKFQSGFLTEFSLKIEDFFTKNFHNAALARNMAAKLNTAGVKFLGSLGEFLKSVGSFMAFILIIPVITFFLIKDERRFKKALISMVPNRYFELSLNILHKTEHQLGKFIQGQAIDALLVGIMSIIGLFIINLVFKGAAPYFVSLGMIAGLANVIPYIGPVVGAVPAIFIAIINSPPNLVAVILWIIVMFVVIQAIDGAIISPLVVSKTVNRHPLTVIVVVLIGGSIAGPLGMLFAVPFTGVIKVIYTQISWGLKNYKISSSSKIQENLLINKNKSENKL